MKRSLYFLFIFLAITVQALAANPPSTQTSGALLKQGQDIRRSQSLEDRVRSPRELGKDEIVGPEQLKDDTGEKVRVNKITVEGVTLLPQDAIDKIIVRFEGKDLSIRGMQMAADLITDEYRIRGFATSRAYIPPQGLKEGVLIIRVVEGKMGKLDVRGNRFFKKSLIERKVALKTGEYFDFQGLQESLTLLNEHPDRNVKAVLAPGQQPGETDVVLNVKDRLPIHVGYNYDNYASRYLGEREGTAYIEHNNFLGFDDRLRFEWRQSRDGSMRVNQGRYELPVSRDAKVGVYGLRDTTRLGREFESLDSRGKATIVGLYGNKKLISNDVLDLRWNMGFDHKDIVNELFGATDSEDQLRIFKSGLDFDFNDRWARNIFTTELDVGVPDMLSGMSSKDPGSSRGDFGSGAKFQKWVFNYFRLQPGPFSSEILWKNNAQVTNHNLVSGEQFQMGGPGSVRGYPIAEFAGDQGIYSSVEWSFPPYLVPRSLKVPFMNRTFFESFRTVLFYDWAQSYTKTVSAGDKNNQTLRSCGLGFRLNLGENLFARVEFGYPLSQYNASDGKNMQTWFEINFKL